MTVATTLRVAVDGVQCMLLYEPQAFALSPVIVLKSRKFAALFTLGSVCSLGRYGNMNTAFLKVNYAHLFSQFLFPVGALGSLKAPFHLQSSSLHSLLFGYSDWYTVLCLGGEFALSMCGCSTI